MHCSSSGTEKDSGCTCGFCDGVKIERETIDPRTGVTVDRSFTVASRRTSCPNCGGSTTSTAQAIPRMSLILFVELVRVASSVGSSVAPLTEPPLTLRTSMGGTIVTEC